MRSSIADTVKAATVAAAELRKNEAEKYPPTPHSWYQLKGQEDDLNAPVLCTSCFLRVDPEGEVRCCLSHASIYDSMYCISKYDIVHGAHHLLLAV